ncbi:hypothetical protein C464_13255 [Halorubrum coriense DSM 10284]|uniref:Uncharacterized protein n=1 Tax=Halorubrum coriense DSM 10284 TaxID=1227466 RepID=M0EDU4_9EURY|nr:hypothetical protein C464_13255 [Halorubrum coriense DSM 10284]
MLTRGKIDLLLFTNFELITNCYLINCFASAVKTYCQIQIAGEFICNLYDICLRGTLYDSVFVCC